MTVSPIPEGYHSITPYLIVRGAAQAIEFYEKSFGARELMRMAGPDGRIGHAELEIGDSRVMLADEFPEMNTNAPQSPGNCGVGICLFVEDVDTTVKQALEAGAQILRPLQDQFYGDRSATLVDPFGHQWTVATHIEDISPEEMEARMAKLNA